jgi:hypothetical protein
MTPVLNSIVLTFGIGAACWAARCTTVAEAGVLREYQDYIARAELAMAQRSDSEELSWAPSSAASEMAAKLAAGKFVRWNISDAALNQRISSQNGTVIHWIGAIKIRGASLAEVGSVLGDYDHYGQIYRPMIFASKTERIVGEPSAFNMILGLQSAFRFASLFPQHYAFQVKGRIDSSGSNPTGDSAVRVHLRASEICESDSGEPGKTDFLEPYHDHGIMWALNTYWRARPRGNDVYLEFETITLARSVQAFSCRIGFIPVPQSVIAAAMDALPADSVAVILEGTKAECERKALRMPPKLPGQ